MIRANFSGFSTEFDCRSKIDRADRLAGDSKFRFELLLKQLARREIIISYYACTLYFSIQIRGIFFPL